MHISGHSSLDTDLQKRVKAVLGEDIRGGKRLYWKAGILLTLYLTFFILPCFVFVPKSLLIPLYSIFAGIAMAGIGMDVMHDANHGSFAVKQKTNKIFGYSMYLVGGYLPDWIWQHNNIHHTVTNTNHDDDLKSGGLFRFSPNQKRRWHHQFQHIYAPVVYSLMTILWITTKDFFQVVRYKREGISGFENLGKHLFFVVVSKIGYYAFWLGLPLLFWKTENWVALASFVGMHLVAGFTLSIVFQPAHVTSLVVFPKEKTFKSIAEHQLSTSCNYAIGNKFITWLSGGLNHQIEHHLFPRYSHVHYPKIAPVVRAFAKEKGLPYNDLGSFWDAIKDHFRHLRELGKKKPQLV